MKINSILYKILAFLIKIFFAIFAKIAIITKYCKSIIIKITYILIKV